MRQPDKIFQGTVPGPLRDYITPALAHLNKLGYKRAINPACGQMTLLKCAVEAGFKPSDCEISDIGFYSSVLGHFYSGRPIDDIPFTLAKDVEVAGQVLSLRSMYPSGGTEAEKASFLLWATKILQLNSVNYYERASARELIENQKRYTETLAEKLTTARNRYGGVAYFAKDIRDIFYRDEHTNDTVILSFPPCYTRGYTKMFECLKNAIDYTVDVEEFDYKVEIDKIWARAIEMGLPIFLANYNRMDLTPPGEVVFTLEKKMGIYESWMCTRPDLLEGMKENARIAYRKDIVTEQYRNAKVFGNDDEITPDTKVNFIQVEKDHALYYRDLWAHRLGNTVSERYYLVLLDGKVFSTVAFHGQKIRLGIESYIFESFGFSAPSKRYPNINRLLMWLITSGEMKKILYRELAGVNRTYDIKGVRTACLSKYRTVKLNNGLLKVTSREKMDNGMYKILYQTDFRQDTLNDVVRAYLAECAAKVKKTAGGEDGASESATA